MLSFLPILAPPSFLPLDLKRQSGGLGHEKTRGETRFPPNGERGSGYFKQLLSALPATTTTRLHAPVSTQMIHRQFTRLARAADPPHTLLACSLLLLARQFRATSPITVGYDGKEAWFCFSALESFDLLHWRQIERRSQSMNLWI